MKKFSKILENKDLSYTSFFGEKISHNDALKDNICNNIIEIIREENNISEKSFNEYDRIINDVKSKFDEIMFNESKKLYEENKRIKYISEILYDKYFK